MVGVIIMLVSVECGKYYDVDSIMMSDLKVLKQKNIRIIDKKQTSKTY